MNFDDRKKDLVERLKRDRQAASDYHYECFGKRGYNQGHYHEHEKHMTKLRKEIMNKNGFTDFHAKDVTAEQKDAYQKEWNEVYDEQEWNTTKYRTQLTFLQNKVEKTRRELLAIAYYEAVMNPKTSLNKAVEVSNEDTGYNFKVETDHLFPKVVEQGAELVDIPQFQMFSKEGNFACQKLVDGVKKLPFGTSKIQLNKYLKDGMQEIAKTHKEVYDSEPRDTIITKVEKITGTEIHI